MQENNESFGKSIIQIKRIMASLNSVNLIGRVGKDPEVRNFEGGNKLATFTIATDESYTDRAGQRQEATEWHNIVLNGRLADIAEKYVRKGSMLYIGGKIKTRSWQDQQGQKHYQTEIVGLQLQLLDKREAQAQAPAPAQPAYQTPAPGYAPQPQYQAPAPPPQYAPQPQYQAPAPPPQPTYQAPVPPAPQYQQPAPPPVNDPAYTQAVQSDLPF